MKRNAVIVVSAVESPDSTFTDADMMAGLEARLQEFYPDGDFPVVPLVLDLTVDVRTVADLMSDMSFGDMLEAYGEELAKPLFRIATTYALVR